MNGHAMRAILWRVQGHAQEFAWAGLVLAAALALAFLPLSVAVVLLGGIAIVILSLIRPHYALYLLALAIPFGSLREIAVGPVALGGAEAVALLVAATWLLRTIALRERISWRAPLSWALLLFLFVGLVSTLNALSLSHSVKEALRWAEVLVIFVAASNLLNGRRAGIALGFLLLGAALEALLGAYQFVFRAGPAGFLLPGGFLRAYGTFEQPNPYAGYLGLLLPVAVALALSAPAAWRSVTARAWKALAAWGAAFVAGALALAGILMSWSRGALVAAFAALLVVIMLKGKRWALVILALAAVIGLTGATQLLPAAITQRFADVVPYFTPFDVRTVEVNDANWAVVERMAHWQAAWNMFSEHPWLGVGFGNYPAVYPAYAISIWTDPLGHAHNYYLNVAAEAGIVGLAAYLLVLGAAFIQTWKVFRRSSGLIRAVAAGTLGTLVYLCVHNLVDNLYVHGLNILLAMLLGIVWALRRTQEDSEKQASLRGLF